MTLPDPRPDATCLITGASSGIGAEIARNLAGRGHALTLVARRQEKLEELAEEIRDRHEVRVDVAPTDLGDRAARDELLEAIESGPHDVDILVNNAGLTTMGPVHRSSVDAETAMVDLDVMAVVHLTTALLPGMVDRGAGGVLNVASTAAFQPIPGQAGYAASKVFVLNYTLGLDKELDGTGVGATALCPGPVATGFAAEAGISDEAASQAMPEFMWENAADVAAAGVNALDQGRRVIIPGLPNRALARASHVLPRGLTLRLLAAQHPAMQ